MSSFSNVLPSFFSTHTDSIPSICQYYIFSTRHTQLNFHFLPWQHNNKTLSNNTYTSIRQNPNKKRNTPNMSHQNITCPSHIYQTWPNRIIANGRNTNNKTHTCHFSHNSPVTSLIPVCPARRPRNRDNQHSSSSSNNAPKCKETKVALHILNTKSAVQNFSAARTEEIPRNACTTVASYFSLSSSSS